MRERVVGVLAAAGAVVLVSSLVAVLEPHVPVLALGVLYVFAVLPVAILSGTWLAVAVAVASMLAFNWFFLPPTHTLQLHDTANWLALAVYLVTAVVVGLLAALARRRTAEAEQQRREAHVLAEAAGDLVRGMPEERALERLAEPLAAALGVGAARLVPGAAEPAAGERGYAVGGVATLLVDEQLAPDEAVASRLLPALAALFAVHQEALEAEALRRSDTLKTALLRAVSHDLRSPLTAILASAGALANDELELDAGDRRDLVEAIREEAQRLDRVVGDLLDLSRLQAGAAEPHRELWSADELVSQAVGANDRVRVELDEAAPPVSVDGPQIERVLANLVDNALKYSPPGTPVVVRVEHGATELRIHVIDQGAGLGTDARDALFRPFERGTNGGRGPGLGLGLAIARGFTEANGGTLWAQEDPTGGHFVLALAAERRAPNAQGRRGPT